MLSIAQAAAKTGLAASAIRYYEDEGLLSVKPMRKAGRRYFDAAALAELALLSDLRRAGMTLADIRHFQTLRGGKGGTCSELSTLAAQRAQMLRAEILALRKAEERLTTFVSRCDVSCGTGSAASCTQLGSIAS